MSGIWTKCEYCIIKIFKMTWTKICTTNPEVQSYDWLYKPSKLAICIDHLHSLYSHLITQNLIEQVNHFYWFWYRVSDLVRYIYQFYNSAQFDSMLANTFPIAKVNRTWNIAWNNKYSQSQQHANERLGMGYFIAWLFIARGGHCFFTSYPLTYSICFSAIG